MSEKLKIKIEGIDEILRHTADMCNTDIARMHNAYPFLKLLPFIDDKGQIRFKAAVDFNYLKEGGDHV